MTKEISIETLVRNHSTYFRGAAIAADKAQEVLAACRPIQILQGAISASLDGSMPITASAAVALGLATEEAAYKEIRQTVRDFSSQIKAELVAISSPPFDRRKIYLESVDCAWNPKAAHAEVGSKNALLTLRDSLLDLEKILGNDAFEDEFNLTQGPLRNGERVVPGSIQDIQTCYDSLSFHAAVYSCHHAVEIVKTLLKSNDVKATIHQFECWQRLSVEGKITGPFYEHKTPVYSLLSDLNRLKQDLLSPMQSPLSVSTRQTAAQRANLVLH